MRLNLGCGRSLLDGWVNVDLDQPDHRPDVILDLNTATRSEWFDATVEAISRGYATATTNSYECVEHAQLIHVIEHIPNHLQMMENLWHVMVPGGTVHIRCPHGASDDAWEDPTHVRPYFPGSFAYYSQPMYWRADYGYRADYRVTQCDLVLQPEADQTLTHIARNTVLEMQVTLEAVKPARAPRRELQERTPIRMLRAKP